MKKRIQKLKEAFRAAKRGDKIWGGVLAVISIGLLIPATRAEFVRLTTGYPYLMSFVKFAVLATMGELLAVRILSGQWSKPKGFLAKACIWGVFGMVIGLMFGVFNGGAKAVIAAGLLPGGEGALNSFLVAFYTSFIMNISFGVVMMGSHRVSDTWVDRRVDRVEGARGLDLIGSIKAVDWIGYISFAVLKTVPLFWIPAHTLVFLLPPAYRVLVAAYLSIVLGAMMAYVKRQAQVKAAAENNDTPSA